jgi:DNA transposition AAA+ family ATPase
MTENQKKLIVNEIKRLVEKTSQKKLSTKAGVSNATISQMVNGKWALIADEMWRKVQVTLRIDTAWKTASTKNYNLIMDLLSASKRLHMSVGLSHDAGFGKSHTYKDFDRMNENVIYVECKNYWSKKSYIKNLLTSAGIEFFGTTEEMIETFISHVMGLEAPIIIIDQMDKLKDPQMDLFMDFYNDLYNHCAFFISGVPALKKRILKGVQRDKIGYREIWSRIGRKFIELDQTSLQDVRLICNVNGVDDEDLIHQAFNLCEGDIRRVRRSMEQYYLIQK